MADDLNARARAAEIAAAPHCYAGSDISAVINELLDRNREPAPRAYPVTQADLGVYFDEAVRVCGICDIEGCHHIRSKKGG